VPQVSSFETWDPLVFLVSALKSLNFDKSP
jgi:hypothetical protein